MRIVRRLLPVVLGVVAACGGGDGQPPPADAPDRLVLRQCLVPEQVVPARAFRVRGQVVDTVGVESVRVRFGGQEHVLPAPGERVADFSVELTPPDVGSFTVEVVAFGVDGATGGVVREAVEVITDSLELAHTLDRATLEARVATWEREGRTPLETYDRGPEYALATVPTVFPIHQNWWLEWMEAGGPQPFLASEFCSGSPEVTLDGEVLACWLGLHPEIVDSIFWVHLEDAESLPVLMPYATWSPAMKSDLYAAFYYAWLWLETSLSTPHPIPPDPPINLLPPSYTERSVMLNRQQTWTQYVATLGHCLALEIGGFVPWSLLDYSKADQAVLLSWNAMYFLASWLVDDVEYVGYCPGEAVHAYPKTSFGFFVDNDIIRPTHYATLARLLEWSGSHLRHFGSQGEPEWDSLTYQEKALMHWQYRGYNPVQRMLAGTIRDGDDEVRHWTRGCGGTCTMYVSILRALNIPAYRLYGAGEGGKPDTGQHSVSVFPTIGQTLSHGDDVLAWSAFVKSVQPPPPDVSVTRLFLPWATFVDWFYTSPNDNLSRQRLIEIPIDVLPDDVLDLYCADSQLDIPLHLTQVYALFSNYYTVQELSFRGLWLRLDDKEAQLNYCK